MFTKKSQKEISEMTDEQAEVYAKGLEAHNAEVAKKGLDALAEKLQEEFKGDLKKANDAIAEAQETIKQLQETNTGKEAIAKGTFVKFVEETILAKTMESAGGSVSHAIKAAALMTTANISPNVAGGYSPLFGNYIDTEIGHTPKAENIILPLVTVKTQPGTEVIWTSDRVNEEGNAQFIAEGALKPLADAEWTSRRHEIKEVAVRWKFTKRLMMHAPAIVQDFEEHCRELVDSEIDDQLLDGTGLTTNLAGLQTLASAFIVPPALAGYYLAPNIYDVIMAMATRVMLSNFKGQITAILNTVWMAKMAGIKATDGQYIIPPFVSLDGKKVGAVNVQFSNKIGDDAILLGELKKYNVVFAETVTYDEGYENDDFSKNLVSKKLEAFLGTYIKASDAGAILFGDISDIQDDLVIVSP